MTDYRLLITEVTNYGDLKCVAGWDLDRKEMIRPEPRPAGFWDTTQVGPNKFEIGTVVSLTGNKPNPATTYPHLTEDRVVMGTIVAGEMLDIEDKKIILKNAAFDSLARVFDGNLIVDGLKAYVPKGAECRSLGGLVIPAKGTRIEPYHNYEGKERLRFHFSDGPTVLAPNMTSTKAYAEHAAGRLEQLNAKIANAKSLILRIGLARSFPAVPDRCYLQVNGLCMI